jgi:hypothetical protein
MRWFVPSWNGDMRLEPSKDGKSTLIGIVRPTTHETRVLEHLLVECKERDWRVRSKKPLIFRKAVYTIDAPFSEVAPLAVKLMRPGNQVLTALHFKDGHIETIQASEATRMLESPYRGEDVAPSGKDLALAAKELESRAIEKQPDAAATVKRPTPCCPQCVLGAVEEASEVLLSFLSEEEHRMWSRERRLEVVGGLSGHRYQIAHRHTETARFQGRICYDLDDRQTMHFHDTSVPPEEEVLATKLILEHREHWLRNEATCFGQTNVRYKNPFGSGGDGLADSAWTVEMGMGMQRELERLRRRS